MNGHSHAESANVYYSVPQFTSDAVASQAIYINPVTQQNTRDETSEENSGIQQSNASKIIDEQASIQKQLKKVKLYMIIAVTVIAAFLFALAIISLALFASVRDRQTPQLPLPDIAGEVTEQVAPLQGNLSLLKNQIDVQSQQLNKYAQQVETLREYAQQIQTLNDITATIKDNLTEYAQQIQTLNDITETIDGDQTEYAQRTERIEDSISHNREIAEKITNSLVNLPVIKTVYVAFRSQPIQVSFKNKNSSTLETLGSISQLSIPNVNLPGTSTDNAIAYRPYFNDVHNSNLAIVFLNLEAAFPCLRDTDVMPVCNLFTLEEDGFLGGRSLVQAADLGNDFRIFSNSRFVKTFGFGFTGCRTFATSCVPVSFERSLVCLLPRNVCT